LFKVDELFFITNW